MKFPQLAQQFALKFAQTHPELDAQILAERACEYANVLAQEIAKRVSGEVPVPRPDFDAAKAIAYSNAIFTALNWPMAKKRQWLLANFNKKSRNDLTDFELERMVLLLLEELNSVQSGEGK